MVTHSRIPAWRNPWTEEPGRLQSMGSQTEQLTLSFSEYMRHFLDGPVVKSPPSNAGDLGSNPGWETEIPHVMEHLSSRFTTRKSVSCDERSA